MTNLRPNSPDGTDTLTNVENLSFQTPPPAIKPQIHFDANADILTVSSSSGTGHDYLGDGAGNFGDGAPGGVNVPGGPANNVAVGDLNNDGILDIAVASTIHRQLDVSLGNGAGNFTPAQSVGFGTSIGIETAIGDVNGDGNADVVTTMTAINGDPPVFVMIGNGDGTFDTPQGAFAFGASPLMIQLADLDGDGSAEALVLSPFFLAIDGFGQHEVQTFPPLSGYGGGDELHLGRRRHGRWQTRPCYREHVRQLHRGLHRQWRSHLRGGAHLRRIGADARHVWRYEWRWRPGLLWIDQSTEMSTTSTSTTEPAASRPDMR